MIVVHGGRSRRSRVVGRVDRFVLLLFRHFLQREEAIFSHLNSLGHVTDTRVLCKEYDLLN